MQNKKTMKGKNLYSDDKGRTVLYIPSEHIGYYIPKGEEQKLSLFQNRFLLALALLILLINLFPDKFLFSIGIACSVLIVLEIMYRRFKNTLDKLKKFEAPKRSGTIDIIAETYSKKDCVTRGIALIGFGVLIVLNAVLSGFSIQLMILNGAVCFLCTVYGCIHLIAASKAK